MSESSITVTVDSKLAPAFAAVGASIGLVVALLVGPVVSWLLDRIETAPAPLRLIDQLPLIWSAPLLTIAGAVVGWIVFSIWNEEVGRVVIDPQAVRVESGDSAAVFGREEIAEIFLDKDELVLVDDDSMELSRTASDNSLADRLSEALKGFGYTWVGAQDPREGDFCDWVDRSPDLAEPVHELLRARSRALADSRTGEAQARHDELAACGVVVRIRNKRQQYRLIPAPE